MESAYKAPGYKDLWLKEKARRDTLARYLEDSLNMKRRLIEALDESNKKLKREQEKSFFNYLCCSRRN